jgi:magnesium chelatase family protein
MLEQRRVLLIIGRDASFVARKIALWLAAGTAPFRAPHHSTSRMGITGRHREGDGWRPGEVHLAHKGVLFLDEAPEFSRLVLGDIRDAHNERASRHYSRLYSNCLHECDFRLILGALPCPCGISGSRRGGRCDCSVDQKAAYFERIYRVFPPESIDRIVSDCGDD